MTAPSTNEDQVNAGAQSTPPTTDAQQNDASASTEGQAAATTTDEPAAQSDSIAPAGNAPVDVPDHVAAELPTGTVVSMNSDSQLVASVEHEGVVHHIVSETVAEFEHLIAAVKNYFAAL